MRFIKAVLWLGAAAASGAAPVASASPEGPGSRDVTITVINNPEQLNETVNRLALPAAGEERSEAPTRQGKETDHARQVEDAHEKSANDTKDAMREGSDNARNDAGHATQDTHEVEHEDSDHSQSQGR